MQQVQHPAFHTISDVFQSNNAVDTLCKEPISESKLAKSNAAWDTDKPILG